MCVEITLPGERFNELPFICLKEKYYVTPYSQNSLPNRPYTLAVIAFYDHVFFT